MVHIKGFVMEDGKLVSVAAGTGEMDTVIAFVLSRRRNPIFM